MALAQAGVCAKCIKHLKAEDISPDRGEAEKKRKHDEILTDEGSDTDEKLATFDFWTYDSDEDPDYEPDSTEEIEEFESDSESEVEAEVVHNPEYPEVELVQLIEKQKDVKLITEKEPTTSEMEEGTRVDEADEISLKPQRQIDETQKRKSMDNETTTQKHEISVLFNTENWKSKL